MRSLTLKLILAFLLVGLIGAALTALIIRDRTRTAFDTFLAKSEQKSLAENLQDYYQAHSGWQGVTDDWQLLSQQAPPPGAPPPFRRDWQRFTLVDAEGRIVHSAFSNKIGQIADESDLDRAIRLTAGDQTVGWLLPAVFKHTLDPRTPEGAFVEEVNRAIRLSALIAAGLALTLSGILAFTMTRSLRELTDATLEIARGELGRQVKVRSKDELGKLALSFNKMSKDLARATHARRQMTADIAHDLRSPLSVIAGYAEALSDGKLPGSSDIYDVLHQETKRLNRLVDDLRLLSLADSGELPFLLQACSPRLLLEQAEARHSFAAQQKGVGIRIEAVSDLPHVTVDIERMAQVFDNLILNALRYAPEGSDMVLSVAQADQMARFQVRDAGRGIVAEDLPYIFDRFYRGDKAREQNGESGLGLAIAKSIVEAHGGAITVESAPGEGTTFTINLPLKPPGVDAL